MGKIIQLNSGKKLIIKVNQNGVGGYIINTHNLNMFIVGKYFNSQVKLFTSETEGWQYIESFFKPDRKIFSIVPMEDEIQFLSDAKNFGALTNEMYCIVSHIENATANKMYVKRNFKNQTLFSEIDPIGSAILLRHEAETLIPIMEKEKKEIYSHYKIEIL